jgi:hypothetical protein
LAPPIGGPWAILDIFEPKLHLKLCFQSSNYALEKILNGLVMEKKITTVVTEFM